jgi:hypothetical protein
MQSPVPTFERTLTALSACLDKAETWCKDHNVDPAVLAGSRLFPDMFPLSKQVQIACDHAKGAAARLTGAEAPNHPDTEVTLADLRDRIATTISYITTVDDAGFAGAEDRTINLKMRTRELNLPGAVYLSGFAMPNFYFHATTAYNIMRHNGVPLGKGDFMGA